MSRMYNIFFFSQIVGKKDSYVFAHDWDMPDRAKLPLWMLGFLYYQAYHV